MSASLFLLQDNPSIAHTPSTSSPPSPSYPDPSQSPSATRVPVPLPQSLPSHQIQSCSPPPSRARRDPGCLPARARSPYPSLDHNSKKDETAPPARYAHPHSRRPRQ